MSENQDNEELNFNELIGNLLTSHNEAHEQHDMDAAAAIGDSDNMTKESEQNPNESNMDIDINHDVHDMDLPDIMDDDIDEGGFGPNASDFTSVVNNAIDLIKPTTNSNTNEQDHETGNVITEPHIDEEQQNEWAHLLQRGLYEEEPGQEQGDAHAENYNKIEQNVGDTQFDDDALDQDDENLRRAILETLQVISNNTIDEDVPNNNIENNRDNNNTFEGIKQVEILDKPTKKTSKKKKKDKDKQKQTSHNSSSSKKTVAESSEQEEKKKPKSKKKSKEKEKSRLTKNESKKNIQNNEVVNNDHLIQIDDVIRGIMESDTLLESNNDLNILNNTTNDFNEINKQEVNNDTNDFETQALVEATLKAFEKELMASETSSVSTTKTKKASTTSKKTSSKSKSKSTTKKPTKSKVSTTSKTDTTTETNKDLDYEIPISSFYPQPKKTTTTTTKKKKKKKTDKSVTASKELQNVLTESSDFQDDEFSKVLAEIVNQVVETSLAEPIEEKEKAKTKAKTKRKGEEREKKSSKHSVDSSSKSIRKDTSENRTSKDKKKITQTKIDHLSPITKAIQPVHDNKEEEKDNDDDEPFDLNQIMQNAMSLAFQTKHRESEEKEEEPRLEERLQEIQIESPKSIELQDSEKLIEVKDKKEHETSKKSEEEEPSSNNELSISERKQKKTKPKKIAKTKKSEKATKLETIKVKKPKEPKGKPKSSKKKTSEPTERKKFETIIIDNFQKKLANNSMSDITNSMRKLNAQAKGRVDNKNREIIIRNVEIEKRFAKLKNGLVMKSQSPEEVFRKKFSLIAAAAANEARKRRRQKNKELRLKLKEEKEKIRIAKKAQKELDQAKFDAEQKELAEIVARGPPYPPDLRLTKKGVPKKPYRRWTPEEMKLRAQLDNESLDEVEPKIKVLKSSKNGVAAITKAPLFNFIRLNVVLDKKNLQDIKETLLKIHLPESYLDYLFSDSGTLGYPINEIVMALENRIIYKFDSSAKTIVHKERFLFHPPWMLPLCPPIALPVARRSIASKKHNKKKTSGIQDTSAFIAVTKKLIPTILNPIINTLKTAAKKRIANGASPEEATRHLLTIINHTKKSIAQVITNARNRQLRQSLTKVKLEDAVNKTALSTIKSNNLNMIPLLNTVNRNKRPLDSTDVQNPDTNKKNVLNVIPLVPLTKKIKRDEKSTPEVIVIPDHKSNTDNNNFSEATIFAKPIKNIKTIGETTSDLNKVDDMVEKNTIIDLNVTKPIQTNIDKISLESSVTDLGTVTTLDKVSNEITKNINDCKTPLLPKSSILENSDSSYNTTDAETNTDEKISDKNDNKHNGSIISKKVDNNTLKERSMQSITLDKINDLTAEQHCSAEVLPNDKNNSLLVKKETKNGELNVIMDKNSLLDTNDLNDKKSTANNIDKSDTNNVNTTLINYSSETSVHPITKNVNSETNEDTIEKSTIKKDSKYNDETSDNIHIETEKNTGSQQEMTKLISSQDNDEKEGIEHIEKIVPKKVFDIETNGIDEIHKNKEEEKDIIKIKQENESGLKKIPIDIPSTSNETIAPNAPIKVESMVQSLVVQQLQNSNEEDGEALPIGITSIITSTLTDLLPKIQQDFITEEKRQRRTGPNSVLNLDGLVPPSQVKMSPAERLLKNPIDRKIKPPKVKERKDTFQVKYNFNIPDFSNISGKKNILQKKLKEFLSNEEFELLRKDISKERKRRWRDANGIQNKINDLRARLRKRATKAFGIENTKEKLEWVDSTFKKKCEEAGFTEFLAQKPNYSEKRDKATITDNDILNMLAINLNRLDLAHKIEASLIEEAKVEVEPKRKKRKIEKITQEIKGSDDSSIITESSESVSNNVKLSKDTVISDNSKDSSVGNNKNPENINDDLKESSNNNPIPDTNIDTRLIAI